MSNRGPVVAWLLLTIGAASLSAFGVAVAASLQLSSGGMIAGAHSAGNALTCTIDAAADTYVRKDQAGSSFGTQTSVTVSNSTTATERILVHFDLSGCSPAIPADALVRSATVRLTTSSLLVLGRSYEIRPVTGSWTETTTWTGQPTVGAVTSTISVPLLTVTGVAEDWPVAHDAQAFIASLATNYGWRIGDTSETGNVATTAPLSFSSREAASNRPQLTITYTP